MQYIDLSLPINSDMLVFPGDPATKLEKTASIDKDGYNDHYLSMDAHAGTHVDASNHMVAGGKTLDQVPLEQFTGRGRLIKLQNGVFSMGALEAADIQAGDIVLFYTGASDWYPDPKYCTDYPAVPKAVAQYLVDKKVNMVGVDACGVDRDDPIAHKILLGGNVLIIEGLTNLGALEGKAFTVHAFPINLQTDGAPVRVIAQVEDGGRS